MTKVYQCDRCKKIFEPRILQIGEPYIARKRNPDIDLCPECYAGLMNFLNFYEETENATEVTRSENT